MIKKDKVEKILISRTDRLGDVILTLPLITEVKKVFNNAKVIFFVKKYTEELLTGYEGVDELLIEEDSASFSQKYKLFRSKNPDLVINVKPRFDLALIFFLLGTKYRIGTGYRWYSFLYNYKVYEHRKISDKHESEYNLNLLKTFFDEVKGEKNFFFSYEKEEELKLDKKLELFNFSLKDKFIIIHPGSGGSAKDLPKEKFSEFIDLFTAELSAYRIVITGLDKESDIAAEIVKSTRDTFKEKIIDLTGKLNLRELLILTDHTELFISNSTGPVHIAGALNKKIIGFYPNEKPMSETRWGPLGNNVIVIKPNSISDDMSKIRASEIMSASKKLLIK